MRSLSKEGLWSRLSNFAVRTPVIQLSQKYAFLMLYPGPMSSRLSRPKFETLGNLSTLLTVYATVYRYLPGFLSLTCVVWNNHHPRL